MTLTPCSNPNQGPIIGLAGRAGSGKSTCAEFLESQGFKKDAYANKMKQAVSVMFGIPMDILLGDINVKSCLEPFWGTTYRQILQKFGTEACRKTFGPDVWEKALWRNYDYPNHRPSQGLVIEDVRFPNEAEAILFRGGRVIEIVRPEAEALAKKHRRGGRWLWSRPEHPSERPLPDRLVSASIINNGSIETLIHKLEGYLYEQMG